MKIDKKRLIICLAIPLVVGGAAGLLTMNSMEAFEALNQPPLSPPGVAVSGGMDGAVCADGHCFVSGIRIGCAT